MVTDSILVEEGFYLSPSGGIHRDALGQSPLARLGGSFSRKENPARSFHQGCFEGISSSVGPRPGWFPGALCAPGRWRVSWILHTFLPYKFFRIDFEVHAALSQAPIIVCRDINQAFSEPFQNFAVASNPFWLIKRPIKLFSIFSVPMFTPLQRFTRNCSPPHNVLCF